jgi:hypothetical protein
MTTLLLSGLKGHHPLGFLAACGLLRCCHQWEDFGSVRLAWGVEQSDGQFTAVIHSGTKLNITTFTQMLICRCKQQRQSSALSWSTKIDDREKFRRASLDLLQHSTCRETNDALATFAALASDIVTTDKGVLRSTLLDLTSGNQRLLTNFRVLAGEPKQKEGKVQPFTEDAVREALLGPWQYRDDDHSLGWDPQTQRLHALRHKVPEQDKTNRSVRAAVFLASQALPLFPCFAVGGQIRTTGFHRDDGDDWFAWPIWRDAISLDTLRSLIAHPFDNDLRSRGVEVMYRCCRVKTGGAEGNYQVFSHSEQRPWPLARRHSKRAAAGKV